MRLALNFHHLHYFWAVAKEGSLTRAAAKLRVAPSALSSQIRQLEEQIGRPLFARERRALVLTEHGKIALAYADEIFTAGDELVSTLARGRADEDVLRVGAVATLSRNFQRSFVQPLLDHPRLRLRLESGSLDELTARLVAHELDVVLSNRPPSRTAERPFRCRRLARQPVSIVASQRRRRFRFPRDVSATPMILPGPSSELRAEFDAICERLGVRVHVRAEVDDMATIRLLVRDTDALGLVPSIVVRDELRGGLVHELAVVPELFESFYAITVERSLQHPLVRKLLARAPDELLAMDETPAD